jgi:hypothetical protein
MFWGPKCLLDHFLVLILIFALTMASFTCYLNITIWTVAVYLYLESSLLYRKVTWKLPCAHDCYLKASFCLGLLFESSPCLSTVFLCALCNSRGGGRGLDLLILFCSPTFQKLNMASSCSHTYIMWPCVQNIVNSTYILLLIYRNNINCKSRCFNGYTMHSYS